MSSKLRKFKYTVTGQLSDCGKYFMFDTPAVVQKVMHKLQGKLLEAFIREVGYNRTDAQNRYYWGVVVSYFVGFYWETQGEKLDPSEVNEYFMRIYNGGKQQEREIFGTKVNAFIFKGTSEMSIKEFSEFIEVIKDHCAQFDLIIPEATGNNYVSDFVK